MILGGAAVLLLLSSQGILSAPVSILLGIGLVVIVNAIAAKKGRQC
ncbi:MAG TPA: hypothetical protein VK452_04670 [Dissulfurispiraceae bacterium]|nr:hypothetical protein [Dissulfurispiraceae bacterium]